MSDAKYQQELTCDERLVFAAEALQRELAMRDMIDNIFSAPLSADMSSLDLVVLKLKGLAITIRMDGNRNHHRGHVHIDYKKDLRAASFAIDTGERLIGRATPYDDKITAWIVKNRKDLVSVWDGMRAAGYNEQTVARLNGNGF